MAKVIGVMGESGAGKTSAMRKLDPKTTMYIDSDMKGLNWKGWKKQYNTENGNYYRTDDKNEVMRSLAWLNCDNGTYAAYQKILGKNATILSEDMKTKARTFKTVVIDTLNGIMVADEVNRMREKGYDIDTQVGIGGYRIDIAVRKDGKYVLGIECDGKLYIISSLNYGWDVRGAALFTVDLKKLFDEK